MNITSQHLSEEMDELTREHADWQGRYEECVRVAYAAVGEKPI
jgi:hypothetical protein